MSDSFWVKWFPSDFLNGISDLTPHEIAVYTVILNRIYDEDKPIEMDIRRIAKRANMRPTTCEKAVNALLENNKLCLVNNCLDNKRALKVRQKRAETRSKSVTSATHRWTQNKRKDESKLPKKVNKNNEPAMRTHNLDDANRMRTHIPDDANAMPVRVLELESRVRLVEDSGEILQKLKKEFDLVENLYLGFGGIQEIEKWVELGLDYESMVTVMRSVLERQKIDKIKSWKYFTTAILDYVESDSDPTQKGVNEALDKIMKEAEKS